MITEATNLQTIHFKDIANLRAPRYRQTADLKVKKQAEAVRFINDVGIALLFPGENMPLPDLWSAINGYERAIPKHHHDWALGKTWEWKDRIPTRKDAWYGKLIRGKPAFIALGDLPAIYALSDNYGELDDYLEAYADGLLSKEGKEIYETLLGEGPMSTAALRKATGMAGGGDNARRFERAITELQSGLKIVKSGISEDNRWKYCYVYDLLLRWAPTLGEQARAYNGRTAMRHVITRYLQTSVAAPPAIFPRLFGWDPGITNRTIDEMLADGTLQAARVVAGPGLTAKAKTPPEGDIWVMGRA
jgi:hypothetical protein